MFVIVIVREAMMEIIVESVQILCRLVSPQTIPNDEPIRIKVTKFVMNFRRIMELQGIPMFHQMISSGQGALRRTNSSIYGEFILNGRPLRQQDKQYRNLQEKEYGLRSPMIFADWLCLKVTKKIVFRCFAWRDLISFASSSSFFSCFTFYICICK